MAAVSFGLGSVRSTSKLIDLIRIQLHFAKLKPFKELCTPGTILFNTFPKYHTLGKKKQLN